MTAYRIEKGEGRGRKRGHKGSNNERKRRKRQKDCSNASTVLHTALRWLPRLVYESHTQSSVKSGVLDFKTRAMDIDIYIHTCISPMKRKQRLRRASRNRKEKEEKTKCTVSRTASAWIWLKAVPNASQLLARRTQISMHISFSPPPFRSAPDAFELPDK